MAFILGALQAAGSIAEIFMGAQAIEHFFNKNDDDPVGGSDQVCLVAVAGQADYQIVYPAVGDMKEEPWQDGPNQWLCKMATQRQYHGQGYRLNFATCWFNGAPAASCARFPNSDAYPQRSTLCLRPGELCPYVPPEPGMSQLQLEAVNTATQPPADPPIDIKTAGNTPTSPDTNKYSIPGLCPTDISPNTSGMSLLKPFGISSLSGYDPPDSLANRAIREALEAASGASNSS